LDPAIALFNVGTMVERLDLPLFPARLAASVLGAFGVLALVLAATGIYGVMAYAISRRTREIGIRMAIGATRGHVLGIVGRRALLLIGSGTLVGLAVAMAAGRFLEQILYGVEPTDPFTLAAVLLLMAGIAALACWVPARRAIRINPVTALRQE
jgi:ABC-type antimicrobial peptide transport system permease subunit